MCIVKSIWSLDEKCFPLVYPYLKLDKWSQNIFTDLQNISPTPRTDRISKDYEKEYPSIEIEGRRTVRKSPSKKEKKHVDNVKLEAEVRHNMDLRWGRDVQNFYKHLMFSFTVIKFIFAEY